MSSRIVLGIIGYSGVGKTTLLSALLPMLRLRGLRTAVIKNTHPDFEIDHPGKDSKILRDAGASQVLLASDGRWALISEAKTQTTRPLDYWLDRLPPNEQDMVLVEGFKNAAIPKLEIYRPELSKPLLCSNDPLIRAVASNNVVLNLPNQLPCLDLNDHAAILHWILTYTGIDRNE
jgi:molybdopterin-guanine dinucleotide biosynthesis protein MobB